MSLIYRIALSAAALVLGATLVFADGIDPGLWKITSRTETGGVIGPPHETARCLTAEQAHDLAATFSPTSRTQNSTCEPIERSFTGEKLTWKLVCKGQLDMELTGEFDFDSPQHYTATTRTKAAMGGMTMVDSQDTLEARRVSDCH
jgi:hypothetical protein